MAVGKLSQTGFINKQLQENRDGLVYFSFDAKENTQYDN